MFPPEEWQCCKIEGKSWIAQPIANNINALRPTEFAGSVGRSAFVPYFFQCRFTFFGVPRCKGKAKATRPRMGGFHWLEILVCVNCLGNEIGGEKQ